MNCPMPTARNKATAAQLHRLNKRLDAAIVVTRASVTQLHDLAEIAGIRAKLPADLLRVKLYWYMIKQDRTLAL